MSYVFVSHASDDKQRVKPLAEALLLQGVKLWLDRPGHGDSHFGFSQDLIQRYQIRSLRAGAAYKDQINEALREAGAVLVCLSRAFGAQRKVLVDELLLGSHHQKLVACIVDDVPRSEIPQDLGLAEPSRLQAERVNTMLLGEAVAHIRELGTARIEGVLPTTLLQEWEISRKLVADINTLLERRGLREPTQQEMFEAARLLNLVPIAPIVRLHEIPPEIIGFFAGRFDDPGHAKSFVARAMHLRRACNSEQYDDRQILVRTGEILDPRGVSPEEFWSVVLSVAGMKSRRTLAAFMLAPGAPSPQTVQPDVAPVLTAFIEWLAECSR